MEGKIIVTAKEAHRSHVLNQVDKGLITLKKAAELMGLSYRQAKRLHSRHTKDGLVGIAHRNRGRPPSNQMAPAIVQRVLELHDTIYKDFNDVHFTEMLKRREGISIGRETVRKLLRSSGRPPKRRRRPAKHHRRRPRKAQMGIMVQWDGSPHPWFGPANPSCSLLAAVDDATGLLLSARFEHQETSAGYLRLLDAILRDYGVPLSIYHDRHSIFVRSDNHWSLEEQLRGEQYPTHMGRVFEELGIRGIAAKSPQAKGRVENKFLTLQDRLCAELAFHGICGMDEANAWLPEVFIPAYNARFGRKPPIKGSAFRPISSRERFRLIGFAYEALVGNDNCVRLGGLVIDIPPGKKRKSYAKKSVFVRQHLDGSWSVWSSGKRVALHEPTDFVEPIRTWKRRARGTASIAQAYINTKPAFKEGNNASSASI